MSILQPANGSAASSSCLDSSNAHKHDRHPHQMKTTEFYRQVVLKEAKPVPADLLCFVDVLSSATSASGLEAPALQGRAGRSDKVSRRQLFVGPEVEFDVVDPDPGCFTRLRQLGQHAPWFRALRCPCA